MPIFEYICTGCGNIFDMLMQSARTVECPACRSKEVTKKFSMFSVAGGQDSASPECAAACEGFDRGSCGSGMCGYHDED